jgi:Tol biopolymer transport system component/DNA-binding winged helix-turn-helix (wHTH) protein
MDSFAILSTRVSFGLFEADLKSGELWKAGRQVKLQSQPFKILTVLLENAGEVVSREELQLRIWGPDVVVDFEHSLGSAIKKVREALGDSADNPRFIQTLSRRGYRFIAPVWPSNMPVELVSQSASVTPVESGLQGESPRSDMTVSAHIGSTAQVRPKSKLVLLTFGLGVTVAAATYSVWLVQPRSTPPLRMSQITQEGRVYTSVDTSFESFPATVTDGTRLFTSSIEQGHDVLSEVTIFTGEIRILPLLDEIGSPEINDISPDGNQLLVHSHLSAEPEKPLWIVPINGGSAFRVSSILAHDATWMPDGRNILYASGNQLAMVSLETGKSTPFATIPGRAFWLRWSPNGKLLRFTLIDSVNHASSLWEISGSQHTARSVLKASGSSPNECCGVWTASGKLFVFQADSGGRTDLWMLKGAATSDPVRVTNGPLHYEAPAAGRKADEIFFVAHDYHSRLEKYDSQQKEFAPLQGFLSHADHVSFSRDRQSVVWVDPVGLLWRAKVDGTDRVQLTPESMRVFLASWSPDGHQLALMARYPGQTWQIFLVNADGGRPERLLKEDGNVADPSFSPDGKSIVFGGVPDFMGQGGTPRSVKVLDLPSGRISELPHSEELFSPRWSPDGHYIAALTLDQQKVMLYDVAAQTWKTLAVTSAADPVWAPDGKAIYIHAYMAPSTPICRIGVPDGRIEEIASLKSLPVGTISRYFFSGIAADNSPLVHAETDSSNLYTMDLNSKPNSYDLHGSSEDVIR